MRKEFARNLKVFEVAVNFHLLLGAYPPNGVSRGLVTYRYRLPENVESDGRTRVDPKMLVVLFDMRSVPVAAGGLLNLLRNMPEGNPARSSGAA
jgi:hypothetical protein